MDMLERRRIVIIGLRSLIDEIIDKMPDKLNKMELQQYLEVLYAEVNDLCYDLEDKQVKQLHIRDEDMIGTYCKMDNKPNPM